MVMQRLQICNNILEKFKHHEFVVGLDHNLDFLKSDKYPQTQLFLEFNIDSDMMPTIIRPTRVKQNSATLMYSSVENYKLTTVVVF